MNEKLTTLIEQLAESLKVQASQIADSALTLHSKELTIVTTIRYEHLWENELTKWDITVATQPARVLAINGTGRNTTDKG